MIRLFRTADLRIGATGRFVQVCFQFRAQFFHGVGIGILWHHNRSNAHQGASTERQIDGGAVPIVQPYEAAGRHCERHDRPSRFARQHDDTAAGAGVFARVEGGC